METSAARSSWTARTARSPRSPCPGQPDRAVALKRRETSELLAEELRRLDPDDTYAAALKFGVDRLGEPRRGDAGPEEPARPASTPAKPAAKKAPAKKAAAK